MAKKIHLILIAILSLHLIAAADVPPTPEVTEAITSNADLTALEQNDNSMLDSAAATCNPSAIPVQNAQFEQKVIELVNQERVNAGFPPLKGNESLSGAGRYHANDMFADIYFNHDSYDRINGNLHFACGVWQRVTSFYTFSTAGENIAAGHTTPENVMAAWMASDGHRANILNPNFRELGVGYYYGDNQSFSHYWVQDFGARANVYPVVINAESGLTENRTVSIYLYGAGVFNEYRIKDDFIGWSAWQPFQANITWTFSGPGNQARTVTIEMRKPNGEVLTSSDSIYLVGQPTLGNLPGSINLLYNRSTGTLAAQNHILQPLNTGTSDVLTWSVSTNGAWISASAASGSTPDQQVTVGVKNPASLSAGTYSGTVTITVTSPSDVSGSPVSIPVTLTVVNALENSVFLPALRR